MCNVHGRRRYLLIAERSYTQFPEALWDADWLKAGVEYNRATGEVDTVKTVDVQPDYYYELSVNRLSPSDTWLIY